MAAHQPNFLPGPSVIEKVRYADACVWLDEVTYSKGGFTNRNRLGDGTWLTVPVGRVTLGRRISDVRVSEHGGWRVKHARTLIQRFPWSPARDELVAAIVEGEPNEPLVELNWRCLRVIFRHYPVRTAHVWQSTTDGGRAVVAEGDDPKDLLPISERLAMMTREMGGTVYLSGPSGRKYLDEAPFKRFGIEVRYYRWPGANPSAAEVVLGRERRAA